MKKRLLSLVMAAALLIGSAAALPEGIFDEFASVSASANSDSDSGTLGDSIIWKIENSTLTISGTGSTGWFDTYEYPPDELPNRAPWYGRTDFNSIVVEEGITELGIGLFYNCENVEKITLPSTLKKIEYEVFLGCDSLKQISVDSKNKYYSSENGVLYDRDKTELVYCPTAVEELIIPDGVETIGLCEARYERYESVLSNCSKLKKIVLPSSLSSFTLYNYNFVDRYEVLQLSSLSAIEVDKDNNEFTSINGVLYSKDCSTLIYCPPTFKEISIGSEVKTIGEKAFCGCNLTQIIIPDNVQQIQEQAFSWCKSLKNVTLPNGITEICDWTFDGCEELSYITIPNSVSTIGRGAFDNTNLLNEQSDAIKYVDKWLVSCPNDKYDPIIINYDTNVIIKSDTVGIADEAFIYCNKINSITLPSGLRYIGRKAFFECSSLKKITIPDSVEKVGDSVFSYCSSLSSVRLSNRLKEIPSHEWNGEGFFYECKSLKSIIIPDSIEIIGNDAFAYCSSLSNVTIGEGVITIDTAAFAKCTALNKIIIGNNVNRIALDAFWGCSSLTSIIIPISVHILGSDAFGNCPNLKSVTVPKSVVVFGGDDYSGHTFGFVYNSDSYEYEKVPDFKIYCYEGSEAESYAKNYDLDYELIECNNHDYKSKVNYEPTCIGYGEKEYVCTLCGDTYTEAIKPLGHKFGDWKVVKEATYKEDGLKERECSVCKEIETEVIPKLISDANYTSGNNGSDNTEIKVTAGKAKDTTLTIHRDKDDNQTYAMFEGVEIDGKVVDPKNYTATKGSLNLKLKASYLSTLTTGKHELKVLFKDGEFVTTLNVEEKSDPVRLAGKGRYETAVEISKAGFPSGAKTVVLAYGLNYADALAGVSLAAAMNAPILLTNLTVLPNETLAEIKRLKATDVIILGGTGAVGAEVETALKKEGLKTERIAGKSRFETATKIAEKMQALNGNKAPEDVFFVYAFNSADALSVSAVAAVKGAPVIYLKTSGDLDDATANYLKSVKGSVKNAYVIGGAGVISDDMMKKAGDALGVAPTRVFGKDRFATCVAVNDTFKNVLNGDTICVATGMDFPDALAGGVFAALNRAPLFLINGKTTTLTLSDTQKSYLKAKSPQKIYTFGGTGAVPDSHVQIIAKASI